MLTSLSSLSQTRHWLQKYYIWYRKFHCLILEDRVVIVYDLNVKSPLIQVVVTDVMRWKCQYENTGQVIVNLGLTVTIGGM
jgi:hypothetical protein